jgi:class 3 adenylate cyclase
VSAGLLLGGLHECDGLLAAYDLEAGISVAIGARIGALARPSEVLVSQTIKDLTAGSGILYTDRGQHQLKGVPDQWRLYQATG